MESRDSTKKIKIDVESKKGFKDENFAYQISKIREVNNLTQKELADLIGVSDRTISKWENGGSVPDGISIRNICNKLGISPSNFLKEKKTLKDYLKYGIKSINKAFKYILHNIFMAIFIVLFIFLFIYFINNYNSVSMYTITYNTKDDLSISRGYFIKNKVRNILLIDNIEITKMDYEIKDIELELFTLVIGEKVSIYKSDNLEDIFITELEDYPEVLKSDVLHSIKNNLYLEVKIIDENDEEHYYKANLYLKDYFSNNKLSYTNYKSENENNSNNQYRSTNLLNNNGYINLNLPNQYIEIEKTNNEEDKIKEKLATIGYEYNKDTKTYFKHDGAKEIEYDKFNNALYYIKQIKMYDYKINYYFQTQVIYFNVFKNSYCVVKYKYFINVDEYACIHGNCDEYKMYVKDILSEYELISTTLQS